MECPYNSVMYDVVHFTMLHVSTAPPLSLHLHSQRGLSVPGGGHLFAPEMKCLNLMLHSNYYLVHVQVNSCINKVPAQRCVSLGEVFSLHSLCTLPLTLMHPLPPMKFYKYIPLNTTFLFTTVQTLLHTSKHASHLSPLGPSSTVYVSLGEVFSLHPWGLHLLRCLLLPISPGSLEERHACD